MGLHNGDELQKYVRKDSGLWKHNKEGTQVIILEKWLGNETIVSCLLYF